jgi:lactoylglutathione lyase
MKIDHIAIWTTNLENVKDFYIKYFNMKCSEKYVNPTKQFSSYFLGFEGEATRIEIMHREDIAEVMRRNPMAPGLTHLSISVGSRDKVDILTEVLRNDGCKIVGEPRTTGDGYYESVVEDCEGNLVEITE